MQGRRMTDATLCAVCSSPLPEYGGMGRPRKTCPDATSPTPGGCARWRKIELSHTAYAGRPNSHRHSRPNPLEWFPNGGYLIE